MNYSISVTLLGTVYVGLLSYPAWVFSFSDLSKPDAKRWNEYEKENDENE